MNSPEKNPLTVIADVFAEAIRIRNAIINHPQLLSQINQAAKILTETARQGGTIYLCGNGGSACDAMHFSEELVARYKRERPGIRAMHFMDPSTLTCWSNDYDYHSAFERQAETFRTSKDALVVFSTSGKSKNINAACLIGKKLGAKTIALTGKDGGALKDIAELSIIVPSNETDRIQEVHITIVHILCELIETTLFK